MHRLPLPLVSFVSGCLLQAAGAAFGLWLMRIAGNEPAFWPSNGLLVALILTVGIRQISWAISGAIVGSAFLNALLGTGMMGFALSGADLVEVVFVALAAQRLRLVGSGLESIVNVVVLVAIISTGAAASALGGAVTLAWFRDIPLADTLTILWRLNATSALMILAPFFAIAKPGRVEPLRDIFHRNDRLRIAELAMIVGVIGVSILVMRQTGVSMISFFTAPLLWCAIRFGSPATAAIGSATSLTVILMIVAGVWPFPSGVPLASQLQRVELALCFNTIPPLFVAAALAGLQKAARDLKLSQERLRYALAGSGEGVWDWNIATNETYFSDGWYTILGYQRDELQADASTWDRLRHPDDEPETRRRIQDHLDGRSPRYSVEQRFRHKDGHWVWVLDRGSVVEHDAEGRPLRAVGTLLDISRRRARQDELSRLAHHDPLTGLANRTALTEIFERWNVEKRSFCFVLIDLDDFKPINDLYGHQFGDHALLAIADRLRACLGQRDIASRIGGDEFALLIEGAEAEPMAQRLIDRISEPIGFAAALVSTGASIGVAVVADGSPDFEGAYRQADIALYDAKASGGATYRIADGQHRSDDHAPTPPLAASALLIAAGGEPADQPGKNCEDAAEHRHG